MNIKKVVVKNKETPISSKGRDLFLEELIAEYQRFKNTNSPQSLAKVLPLLELLSQGVSEKKEGFKKFAGQILQDTAPSSFFVAAYTALNQAFEAPIADQQLQDYNNHLKVLLKKKEEKPYLSVLMQHNTSWAMNMLSALIEGGEWDWEGNFIPALRQACASFPEDKIAEIVEGDDLMLQTALAAEYGQDDVIQVLHTYFPNLIQARIDCTLELADEAKENEHHFGAALKNSGFTAEHIFKHGLVGIQMKVLTTMLPYMNTQQVDEVVRICGSYTDMPLVAKAQKMILQRNLNMETPLRLKKKVI